MQSLTMMGFDRRFSEYTLVGYDTLGTCYVTAAGKYRFVWASASKSEHIFRQDYLTAGKWVRVAETRLM